MLWIHCVYPEEKREAILEAPKGFWLATWGDSGLYRLKWIGNLQGSPGCSECPAWLERAWNDFWGGRPVHVPLCTERKPSPKTAAVWRVVSGIPFGATLSYGEVARSAGLARGARAVGAIMRANPWPLFLPCHRVVGKNGELRGYGGKAGVALKAWLIEYERKGVQEG